MPYMVLDDRLLCQPGSYNPGLAPTGLVTLDRNHPLGRRVLMAAYYTSSKELVSGRTFSGNLPEIATYNGQEGWIFNGTSHYLSDIFKTPTTNMTFFAVACPTSTTANQAVLSFGSTASNGYVYFNFNASLTSDPLTAGAVNGTGAANNFGEVRNSPTYAEWLPVWAEWPSANVVNVQQSFRNLAVTSADTSGSGFPTCTECSIGSYLAGSRTAYFVGGIKFACIMSGIGYAEALAKDPYQFLTPA